MTYLSIAAGPFRFRARLEEAAAPRTCARFVEALPFANKLVHVRWSGEACWIPMGDFDFGVPLENLTSYPAPGHVLLYPGGFSETELLVAYGAVRFSSKMGQLAGNHFLTIVDGLENLPRLGSLTLQHGAQSISFAAES